MSSIRLILASIVLLAFPVASAAPLAEDRPEPVEAYACLHGGVTVIVLGDTVVECFPSPGDRLVERCGTVAFQVGVGPYQTECIVVFEHYFCPGGGGYFVVLGVQVGQCTVCCEPTPLSAGPPSVEITQCDHWGNGVAVDGKEVVCITTGCSPMCMDAAEADVPEVTLSPCSYHPPGRQVYYGDEKVGPCILLPQPEAHASGGPEPFPLVRVASCPEGQGSRIYLTGEGIQVTECSEAPASVDLRCQDPAYGVQVYVDGQPVTSCIPLPHGV